MEKRTQTWPLLLLTLLCQWVPAIVCAQTIATAQVVTWPTDDEPDTLAAHYTGYPYISFVSGDLLPLLSDQEFYEKSARVVFPVNKWTLPKNDPTVQTLQREVLPLLNRDSMELVGMMMRGAASPEGPYKWNKFLGEHRAETLIKFLHDNMAQTFDEDDFNLKIDHEDYRTLCLMMRQHNDADYPEVQQLCDAYLPSGDIYTLKRKLQQAQQGRLWRRLLRDYFPQLRAARVVFFVRKVRPKKDVGDVFYFVEADDITMNLIVMQGAVLAAKAVKPMLSGPLPISLPQPRRELLSVKTNLLFDLAYMPGYDRWCPLPNIAIEYYPLFGHFTFGASLDLPWWQDYDGHKFFQVRNWQVETRYYLQSGSILHHLPGQGAAFRGPYVQAYGNAGVFGICFDADRGWVGEGYGGGLGMGYVMPLSRSGHCRLEFGLQAGFFTCKYDPYKYENPIDPDYHDNLYYYKWTLAPELFKKRQYRWNWIGPTRIGVTISYDLVYRKAAYKKPHSLSPDPSRGGEGSIYK